MKKNEQRIYLDTSYLHSYEQKVLKTVVEQFNIEYARTFAVPITFSLTNQGVPLHRMVSLFVVDSEQSLEYFNQHVQKKADSLGVVAQLPRNAREITSFLEKTCKYFHYQELTDSTPEEAHYFQNTLFLSLMGLLQHIASASETPLMTYFQEKLALNKNMAGLELRNNGIASVFYYHDQKIDLRDISSDILELFFKYADEKMINNRGITVPSSVLMEELQIDEQRTLSAYISYLRNDLADAGIFSHQIRTKTLKGYTLEWK
jgi:hypothetical protein